MTDRCGLRAWSALGLFLAVLVGGAVGQAPSPEKKDQSPRVVVVGPLGATPGVPTKVRLWGLRLDTATEVRFADPRASGRILTRGKSPVPANQPPERFGDSVIEVEVLLPAGLSRRTTAFTVLTPAGTSLAHDLLVNGEAGAIAEKEPNNGFPQAQPVPIGAEIDGTINGPQDVDVYRIEGKAGQRLVVEVRAARHGSPLDSVLTLYDAAGRAIAVNDDFDGSADSRVEVVLPADGPYFVGVADANDQGGAQHGYRLVIAGR